MNNLINKIKSLKNSEISNLVYNRINEFKELSKKSNDELFKELCFCILTANFNAEKSIKIQDEIGECFLNDSEEELAKKLKNLGYRFPNTRTKYILESRKYRESLEEIVQSNNSKKLREWIVNNVKGLGYKEASHFLRNIGFNDLAIIDFHIVDILVKHNLIERPKALTKRKYLKIENLLKEIARKTDLSLAELDLYLWYLETGKILK
jgi:N-glycosylase/DNA lyase